MSRYYSILLLCLFLFVFLVGNVESCHRCSKVRAFTKIVCSNTRYPIRCEQTLLTYINSTNQSQQQLAQIAVKVSLDQAESTRAYLTRLASRVKGVNEPEYQSIGSCIDHINDSVDQLKQSLSELQQLGEQGVTTLDDFMWHSSNLETWTSAALTCQTTCIEAFSDAGHGKSIKAAVKAQVTDVAQVTSNALALINRFVTRYRFSRNRGIHRP